VPLLSGSASKQIKVADNSNKVSVTAEGWKGKNVHPSEQQQNKERKAVRKLEQIEAVIGELEEKLRVLKELMELHNSDGRKLGELYTEQERMENDLNEAYAEWEQLLQG
jgi:cell shape-determining protein MreC